VNPVPAFLLKLAAGAFLAVGSLSAKTRPPPDVSGAKADGELRCVANWASLLVVQAREPDADTKAILAMADRIDPFVSEVQNKVIDVYHMTDADTGPILAAYMKEAKAAYESDKATTVANHALNCVPVLEAREAVRIPHTPLRCAALLRSDAMLASFSGIKINPGGQIDVAPDFAGIAGLVESTRWERWALNTVMAAGSKEKQAQKLLADEKKRLAKEVKEARKNGRAVVFDRLNCRQRYKAAAPSTKAATS
jgi:hypothetical protein